MGKCCGGGSQEDGGRCPFGRSATHSLRLPLPPLNLQEEFASVVARVESLQGRMGESTRQVDRLFECLLSQSFGG